MKKTIRDADLAALAYKLTALVALARGLGGTAQGLAEGIYEAYRNKPLPDFTILQAAVFLQTVGREIPKVIKECLDEVVQLRAALVPSPKGVFWPVQVLTGYRLVFKTLLDYDAFEIEAFCGALLQRQFDQAEERTKTMVDLQWRVVSQRIIAAHKGEDGDPTNVHNLLDDIRNRLVHAVLTAPDRTHATKLEFLAELDKAFTE